MKIIASNRIYIQKKDLELIFEITDKDKIPSNIVKKYQQNINIKELDFLYFEENEEVEFINNYWFVINYKDIIDFDDEEIREYNWKDLEKLRQMRIEHDKHKFIFYKKIYNNDLEFLLDQVNYECYLPNKENIKTYPLEFRLLYNKVSDVFELINFKSGNSKLEIPEEILKPVRYSKKQLQRIYNEVLSEELSFEELKPYEKQLYCIFEKINYTPYILDMIRKITIINRYNTLDFINDDLLNILLRVEGKKTKFEELTTEVIDYLYAIGYNNFDNLDSKIILEKDLKIIKKIIDYIGIVNLEDEYIDILSNYNYVLAEIIRVLKKCNYSKINSLFIRDIFSNIAVYVHFNPNIINYNYDFLVYVYDYIINNSLEIMNITNYYVEKEYHNEHFVYNFNISSNLLMYLYNKKYNSNIKKDNILLIKSKIKKDTNNNDDNII